MGLAPVLEFLLPLLVETALFAGFDAFASGGRKSISTYRALGRRDPKNRLRRSLGRGGRLGLKTLRSPTTLGVAAGFAGLNALLGSLGGGEGGIPDSHVAPRVQSPFPFISPSQLGHYNPLPQLPSLEGSNSLPQYNPFGGGNPQLDLVQRFQQGGLL